MAFQKTLKHTLILSAAAIVGFIAFQVWHEYQGSDRPDPAGVASVMQSSAAGTGLRPTFELMSPEGVPVSSRQWDGKPLVVNFWATWCAPCRREIPMLMEMQSEHSAAGLQLIGIALDLPDAVDQYAKEMEMNYPLLVGEQDAMDVAEAFGLDLIVLPGTVFSLSDGRTLHNHIGELHADQATRIIEILWQTENEAIDFAGAQALLEAMD
ncbi:MAG: TlpA family protein disulfide reductase [Proteobacteria bacterium]|nr:TlpA family protein disulfide reductase [Pseudomonadota bacterium]